MSGDVIVYSLSSAGVGHADVVVHQQLGHDVLLGEGRALGEGGVRGIQVRGRPGSESGAVGPLGTADCPELQARARPCNG